MPQLAFPPLTPMVKYLIIINCAVFLLQVLAKGRIEYLFAAEVNSNLGILQVWRLVTFQFLHGSFGHLFANMLGLYFFGTAVERTWGSRHFLRFYLFCGALGGVLYMLACTFGYLGRGVPLVGASGGVLGVMVACAVMFPQIKVLLFFILPIPIRVLVAFITFGYVINVLQRGNNAGGDLCHLGGMATAVAWIFLTPALSRMTEKRQEGAYQRKLDQERALQYEVDRILAKVHEKGIHSLTRKEKQILQHATESQRRG